MTWTELWIDPLGHWRGWCPSWCPGAWQCLRWPWSLFIHAGGGFRATGFTHLLLYGIRIWLLNKTSDQRDLQAGASRKETTALSWFPCLGYCTVHTAFLYSSCQTLPLVSLDPSCVNSLLQYLSIFFFLILSWPDTAKSFFKAWIWTQNGTNVKAAIMTAAYNSNVCKGSSWYLCSSYCSKIQIHLVNENKNNYSLFDCRHWLGKSSQTLQMLSGKLRSCNWIQFLDKHGKYWGGLLIHQSSLWEGLNPFLEASIERKYFLLLPVEMIKTAYPAWRKGAMNYLSATHCKRDVLWIIVELGRK